MYIEKQPESTEFRHPRYCRRIQAASDPACRNSDLAAYDHNLPCGNDPEDLESRSNAGQQKGQRRVSSPAVTALPVGVPQHCMQGERVGKQTKIFPEVNCTKRKVLISKLPTPAGIGIGMAGFPRSGKVNALDEAAKPLRLIQRPFPLDKLCE